MRFTRRCLPNLVLGLLFLCGGRAEAGNGFLLGWSLPEGADSHSVALGDVDGDGDVDAYVSEAFARDVVWLNDGSAHFTRSPALLDIGYGSCALLAPLDNNSSLDLFLLRHFASSRVWTNNGSGVFSDSGQSIGASTSRRRAALGDLDGDLDLDAVLPADTTSSSNEIYINNGAGTFTASTQLLGSYSSRAVALGDIDADGDLDALLANNGPNKLWRNNGSATFTDSGQTVGTRGTFDVALADLDGDSDLDAFFANGSVVGDPEEVWKNDGTGVFTNSGQLLGDDYSFSVVLFHCDGDGDLDAFVGNNTGQPNLLYLNNGSGTFSASAENVGNGGAFGAAARDLDGDSDLDLFLANAVLPEQVFLNDGQCHFSRTGQVLGGTSAEAVALGDLDGDSDLDAVVGTYGGFTRILRNQGTGNFLDDDQWLDAGFAPSVGAVRVGDFDGDLDLDIWTGLCCSGSESNDDAPGRIWMNDGSGLFTDSGERLGSEYTTGGAVGDVDGDLDLDLVVSNYPSFFSAGTSRLYRNDGAGHFTQDPQALTGAHSSAIALGDLNDDGDLDLFIADRGGPSKAWGNDGAGTFTASPQNLGNAVTTSVALGDLDGDGDLDAFLGNIGGNTVWLNGGIGQFTSSGQTLGSADTVAVHLFDADSDGDVDAWATNGEGTTQPSQLWLNDGTGHFTDAGWPLASMRAPQSAIGDLDGDNDLDLYLASFDGDDQVWLNQRAGPIFSNGFASGNTGAWSATVP